MSGLVTLIVLAYLLVIALALALWSLASMRRVPTANARDRDRELDRSAAERSRYESSTTHDAYRGVRAQRRVARTAVADPFLADDRAPDASFLAGQETASDSVQNEAPPTPAPSDGIRVLESRRERERKAEARAAERARKDDAFDRFLRANEDFDR